MQTAMQFCDNEFSKKILLIENDGEFCRRFAERARKLGIEVGEIRNLANLEPMIHDQTVAAVLVDADMENASGFQLIRAIMHRRPRVNVFVLIKDDAIQDTPTFLEGGVSNIYPLSLGPDKIAEQLTSKLYEAKRKSPSQPSTNYSDLIGRSPGHIRVVEQISRMKDASASVLLTGESGTGKELVARALHQASTTRSSGAFEAINCGAVPEHLLESELFGYKKGAFTDAKAEKKGLFEVCSNGILFLDEIGEMPLSLQVKLLRVLQEKEIRPLGGTNTIKVNTRVVAATNRDLLVEVKNGRFRKDLYYRLAILKIHIPPLRERVEDVPLLVEHFIEKYAKENHKQIRPLTTSQLSRLKFAEWPGNIRELQNAIERAIVLSSDNEINLDDIFEEGYNYDAQTPAREKEYGFEMPLRHADAKRMFESCYLRNLLKHAGGNVTKAAKLADKTRVEIYRYLSRNQIAPAKYRV